MELQYTGALIVSGRTSKSSSPTSLLGTGVLVSYKKRAFILTSAFTGSEINQALDLVAIMKVHDGQQARRIQFGLNRSSGYRYVHPSDNTPVTHGYQLYYVSNNAQELRDKGLSPFKLPASPNFAELEEDQPIRILGLHARQINQKVLGADDLVLPWSLADAHLLTSTYHDVTPTEHNPQRFKSQLLARMDSPNITDDWYGSLTFAKVDQGWAPIGLQSLYDAHLINKKIITEVSDHPPLLAITPLQSLYTVLEQLPL